MKLKHFLAFLTFFACFAASVWLVGLRVPAVRTNCFDRSRTTQPSFQYLETQKRLQAFLEKDRRTGIELADDQTRLVFNQKYDYPNAQRLATAQLVVKMRKVECRDLPKDFCTAWEMHLKAWTDMSDFLERAAVGKNWNDERDNLSREIGRSYNEMLASARRHGVDFR